MRARQMTLAFLLTATMGGCRSALHLAADRPGQEADTKLPGQGQSFGNLVGLYELAFRSKEWPGANGPPWRDANSYRGPPASSILQDMLQHAAQRDPSHVETLLRACLRSEDSKIRWAFAEILMEFDPSLDSLFLVVERSRDWDCHMAALAAASLIGRKGAERHAQRLERMLKELPDYPRRGAEDAIRSIRKKAAEDDPRVQADAARPADTVPDDFMDRGGRASADGDRGRPRR